MPVRLLPDPEGFLMDVTTIAVVLGMVIAAGGMGFLGGYWTGIDKTPKE